MTTGQRDASAPACAPPEQLWRVWTPRPWREESRRTDLVQVGRFAFERALRRPELVLSPGAHHVASVLASYGDARGRDIFPSQQTLAAVCRRSVRHIRAKLRELTELGLMRRLTHGGGRPSWRDGRRRRVTPARYELTLPGWLADHDGKDGGTRQRQPGPPGQPGTATDASQSADAEGTMPDRLSAGVVEQICAALGVTDVTEEFLRAALAAAVNRAPGQVTNPVAYAMRVIASDPAAFRPTPDVPEPACPRHPGHPSSRCPDCAAARNGPSEEWRRIGTGCDVVTTPDRRPLRSFNCIPSSSARRDHCTAGLSACSRHRLDVRTVTTAPPSSGCSGRTSARPGRTTLGGRLPAGNAARPTVGRQEMRHTAAPAHPMRTPGGGAVWSRWMPPIRGVVGGC